MQKNLHFQSSLLNKIVFLFFFLLVGNLQAQDPAQYGIPFSGVPDPRDVSIYQVSTRQFSAGRNLQGVTTRLDSIKALGVNVVYLMPIFPIGVLKAGGSPYAIADFTSVASDLGSLTDLRNLVDAAHSKGMSVMLDWVVNQTSWDHPWVTAHKDWYLQDGSGAILSPTPSPGFFFTDCAALNFSNTSMVTAMTNAMRYWVFAANIDGFRCDWADNPPSSFWSNLISNLRGISSHKLLMLAEGSNEGTTTGCNTCGQNQPGAHYGQGFDFIFGEGFYWNFTKKIFQNSSPATVIDGVTTGEYVGANANQLVARYMSNHDEYGSDGSPYTWMGGKAQVLADFVIATYMRGVPFIYNGQEVGNTSVLAYPWNTGMVNWTQDVSITPLMKQILAFRKNSDAIRRGTPTSYTSADVVAFTKTSSLQTAFVAVNVRNTTLTYTLPAGIANTTMYNGFTNASVVLGATISLAPYQYLVFTNSLVSVASVALNASSASIAGAGTFQLTAAVSPANANNQTVVWTSSNTAVASVNRNGLVTGVSAGTATITVKTNDGAKTATCSVSVTSVAVTGVSLNATTASISTSGSVQLSETILPTNASNKTVSWTSSNTGVASVSASGLVTGLAVGTSIVTVTTNAGAKTATCTITVSAAPKFTVYFLKPAAWGTAIKIYWWSALPAGALADGTWPGASMSLTNGWYAYTFNNVTATNLIFNDGTSQSADLNRTKDGWYSNGVWYDTNPGTNVAVTGVSLNLSTAALAVSATQQLSASVLPSNATNLNVAWSSSNTAIATVSATGLVTAIAPGTASIKVTTADQAKTANCAVTVSAISTTYYQIVNRWKTTSFLKDAANGQVAYGTSPTSTDFAYQWEQVNAGSGYVQLKNRATGNFMHIENQTGSVQCGAIQNAWYSAMWLIAGTGDGWNYIQNRYLTGSWIHVENQTGYAQYAGPQSAWFSAEWQFVNPTTKSLTIEIEESDNSILVPNPVKDGQIYIFNKGTKSIEHIQILDLKGSILYQTNVNSENYRIDASTFNKGLYLLKITTSQSITTHKIVIQ